ncbi:MAG: hypothetical protein AAF828_04495 [Bacteroidota bacterium]
MDRYKSQLVVIYLVLLLCYSCNDNQVSQQDVPAAEMGNDTSILDSPHLAKTEPAIEETPIDSCAYYFRKSLHGFDTASVKSALANGCKVDEMFSYGKSRTSLLRYAVSKNDLDFTDFLLDLGANPVDTSGGNYPPFFMALHKKVDDSILMNMLNEGIDANFSYEDAHGYRSPIDVVARNGNVNKAKILLDFGATAAHTLLQCCGDGFGEMITISDRAECLQLLLKFGADFKNKSTSKTAVIDLIKQRPELEKELERRSC